MNVLLRQNILQVELHYVLDDVPPLVNIFERQQKMN